MTTMTTMTMTTTIQCNNDNNNNNNNIIIIIITDIRRRPVHGIRDDQISATSPGPPIRRTPTKIAIDSHDHVVDIGRVGISQFSALGRRDPNDWWVQYFDDRGIVVWNHDGRDCIDAESCR